ncbi:hypothetical protein IFR04_015256 [Cadophora malorum]|uniref:Galactose oxidase-like Early set domain-containing protein n=1 Tax=Cadophora malorum TaxID=108018 RepID=A0A8H7SY06_9HELO|nr:hypothetical protein IFR04_015256 [Cadophora malorum]
MAVPRNYRSMSLLLADGTVYTGGGGLCPTAFGASDGHCNRAIDHPNGGVFTTPYLVKADRTPATRPVINSLSSNSAVNGFSVRPGGTLNVEMNDGTGVTFALLRIGSATHSVNSDQRRIALTNVVANGNQFTITIPTDSGVLTPGPYFLFALSKNKVPSMARTARVTR